MKQPTDDSGHDKGVSETSGQIGHLVTSLYPVVADPASGDVGDPVKAGHRALSEETRKEATDHAANTMGSEDIESLINPNEEFELGSKVTGDGSNRTDGKSSWGTDEASSRGDTDQTRDSARTEANSGPLALKPVVQAHPDQTTNRGRKVGDDTSLNSPQVGGKSGTTIEAEPTEPEEYGADDNESSVVGLVGEPFSAVASTLAEVQGDSKRGSTRRDVNGGTTSKVETAHDKRPAVGVPCPASEWAIDKGEPAEEEDHNGTNTRSFSETTNGKDTSDELQSVSLQRVTQE